MSSFIRILCQILFFAALPFAVACDSDISAHSEAALTPSSGNYLKVVFDHYRPPYEVEIDYDQPPDEMINGMIDAGHCDDVADDIVELDIPVQGSGKVKVELVLVQFDKIMTSEQVVAELEKRGLEPARYEHLIAFFARYSDIDLGDTNTERRSKFPVVAPGSLVYDIDGIRYMPGVNLRVVSLFLTADADTSGWHSGVSFLAVVSQVKTSSSP